MKFLFHIFLFFLHPIAVFLFSPMYKHISVCDVDNKCVRMEIDIDMGWHLYLNGERYTNFYLKLEHNFTSLYRYISSEFLFSSSPFLYVCIYFRCAFARCAGAVLCRTIYKLGDGRRKSGCGGVRVCVCRGVVWKISSFTALLIIN